MASAASQGIQSVSGAGEALRRGRGGVDRPFAPLAVLASHDVIIKMGAEENLFSMLKMNEH
jgi:hypothetical protein